MKYPLAIPTKILKKLKKFDRKTKESILKALAEFSSALFDLAWDWTQGGG